MLGYKVFYLVYAKTLKERSFEGYVHGVRDVRFKYGQQAGFDHIDRHLDRVLAGSVEGTPGDVVESALVVAQSVD
jgi:hypothetical protein